MKADYPPILSEGVHDMTLSQLRRCCVDDFQLSRTRRQIMAGLDTIVKRLLNAGITAKLWVDGSFLSTKIDPEDADIVVRLESDLVNSMTPKQENVVQWIDGNLKNSLKCDSYLLVVYPTNHALHSVGRSNEDYWLGWFGRDRTSRKKGIASIEIPTGAI